MHLCYSNLCNILIIKLLPYIYTTEAMLLLSSSSSLLNIKKFLYIHKNIPWALYIHHSKKGPPIYWMCNENISLSLAAFTKATNLVVSLISYSYLIWDFNCYFNFTIINLNWTIRLVPTIGIKNYPSAYPTCNDAVNGQWSMGKRGAQVFIVR